MDPYVIVFVYGGHYGRLRHFLLACAALMCFRRVSKQKFDSVFTFRILASWPLQIHKFAYTSVWHVLFKCAVVFPACCDAASRSGHRRLSFSRHFLD